MHTQMSCLFTIVLQLKENVLTSVDWCISETCHRKTPVKSKHVQFKRVCKVGCDPIGFILGSTGSGIINYWRLLNVFPPQQQTNTTKVSVRMRSGKCVAAAGVCLQTVCPCVAAGFPETRILQRIKRLFDKNYVDVIAFYNTIKSVQSCVYVIKLIWRRTWCFGWFSITE